MWSPDVAPSPSHQREKTGDAPQPRSSPNTLIARTKEIIHLLDTISSSPPPNNTGHHSSQLPRPSTAPYLHLQQLSSSASRGTNLVQQQHQQQQSAVDLDQHQHQQQQHNNNNSNLLLPPLFPHHAATAAMSDSVTVVSDDTSSSPIRCFSQFINHHNNNNNTSSVGVMVCEQDAPGYQKTVFCSSKMQTDDLATVSRGQVTDDVRTRTVDSQTACAATSTVGAQTMSCPPSEQEQQVAAAALSKAQRQDASCQTPMVAQHGQQRGESHWARDVSTDTAEFDDDDSRNQSLVAFHALRFADAFEEEIVPSVARQIAQRTKQMELRITRAKHNVVALFKKREFDLARSATAELIRRDALSERQMIEALEESERRACIEIFDAEQSAWDALMDCWNYATDLVLTLLGERRVFEGEMKQAKSLQSVLLLEAVEQSVERKRKQQSNDDDVVAASPEKKDKEERASSSSSSPAAAAAAQESNHQSSAGASPSSTATNAAGVATVSSSSSPPSTRRDSLSLPRHLAEFDQHHQHQQHNSHDNHSREASCGSSSLSASQALIPATALRLRPLPNMVNNNDSQQNNRRGDGASCSSSSSGCRSSTMPPPPFWSRGSPASAQHEDQKKNLLPGSDDINQSNRALRKALVTLRNTSSGVGGGERLGGSSSNSVEMQAAISSLPRHVADDLRKECQRLLSLDTSQSRVVSHV